MRKTTKYFLIVVVFLITGYGCTETDDGSFTAPITVYEKLPGTWQLLSLKLVDETAKASGIKPDEIALTDQFNFQTFSITLEVDAQFKPGTYSVSGEVPELLAPEGFWNTDSEFPLTDGTPLKISLYADAACTQRTNQLMITALPGATSEMELKLTHTSNQVAYATYVYRLFRAEEE